MSHTYGRGRCQTCRGVANYRPAVDGPWWRHADPANDGHKVTVNPNSVTYGNPVAAGPTCPLWCIVDHDQHPAATAGHRGASRWVRSSSAAQMPVAEVWTETDDGRARVWVRSNVLGRLTPGQSRDLSRLLEATATAAERRERAGR